MNETYLIQTFNHGEQLFARIIGKHGNGNLKAMVYDTMQGGRARQRSLMNLDLWRKVDADCIPSKILAKLNV